MKYFSALIFFCFLAGIAYGATQPAPVKIDLKPRQPEEKVGVSQIFGYTQIMLEIGAGKTNEAISFRDVNIGIKGELKDGVSYKTEFSLKDAATSGAVSLAEAYLDLADFFGKGAVFRFGRFKVPFGYDFSQSSLERIYLNQAYYRNCFWSKYDFGVENYSRVQEGAYDLALINGEGTPTDSSKSKDFACRYIIKKGSDMEIGFSEYWGSYEGNNRNNFGIYLKSKQANYLAVFEYENGTDKTGTNRTLDFHNAIIQKVSDKLENVFVYESWDPNIDVAGDSILAYTLGVNYYRTENVKFISNARFEKVETAADYTKSLQGMVQVSF